MEVEREVKTYKVDIKCPDCEIIMNKIYGSQKLYKYECSLCNSIYDSTTEYPYFKYI